MPQKSFWEIHNNTYHNKNKMAPYGNFRVATHKMFVGNTVRKYKMK